MSNIKFRLQSVLDIHATNKSLWYNCADMVVWYRDAVPWALQKQLNRSRCCLGYGFRWSKGTMY